MTTLGLQENLTPMRLTDPHGWMSQKTKRCTERTVRQNYVVLDWQNTQEAELMAEDAGRAMAQRLQTLGHRAASVFC